MTDVKEIIIQKPSRSSGQKGLSRTKTKRRRGARNRRRIIGKLGRITKGQFNASYDKSSFKKFSSSIMASAPAAISGASFRTYFRQSGQPRHKEWGTGCRFAGISLLGALSTTVGSATVFTPIESQYGYDSPISAYYDLYAAAYATAGNGSQATPGPLSSLIFSLHPSQIPRLNTETSKWGRYVFRNIEIFSECQSSTQTGEGWVVGLSHDVSFPLNQGTLDFNGGDNNSSIASTLAQLDNHANGSMWKCFNLRSGDYRGDKTWPCTAPQLNIVDSYTGIQVSPSFLQAWVETTYQYCWGVITGAGKNAATGLPYCGNVYLKYDIDFYSITNSNDTNATPMQFDNGGLVGDGKEKPIVAPRLRIKRTHRPIDSEFRAHTLAEKSHLLLPLLRRLGLDCTGHNTESGTDSKGESPPCGSTGSSTTSSSLSSTSISTTSSELSDGPPTYSAVVQASSVPTKRVELPPDSQWLVIGQRRSLDPYAR